MGLPRKNSGRASDTTAGSPLPRWPRPWCISKNGGRVGDRGRMHRGSPYRRRRPYVRISNNGGRASDDRFGPLRTSSPQPARCSASTALGCQIWLLLPARMGAVLAPRLRSPRLRPSSATKKRAVSLAWIAATAHAACRDCHGACYRPVPGGICNHLPSPGRQGARTALSMIWEMALFELLLLWLPKRAVAFGRSTKKQHLFPSRSDRPFPSTATTACSQTNMQSQD